jgi:hypothetical protein
MRIRLGLILLPALVAALLLWVFSASAADHRDAPTIENYSAIDINDVFMFRDPPCSTTGCTSPNLVMVLSTQAIADPSFGLSYHFQSNALYRFNFSTTPKDIQNGIPTASIDIVFSPFGNSSTCPASNPPCQTYRMTFKGFPGFPNGLVFDGLTTQGSAAATPKPAVVTEDGPVSAFAGPREDPFFFDLVGFKRFIADFNGQTATPAVPHFNLFTGKDAFLGKNINAIVVEFPINDLLAPGSTKLAAWGVTFLDNSKDPSKKAAKLQQVDRMGNPGVNTVLIPTALNDAFNFGQPQDDAKDFGATIAASLIRFGVDQVHVLPALATAAIPDTLKFDTTLPDGYLNVPPNGRRLGDRTTDFLLTLFFNVQGPPGSQHPGNLTCPTLAQTAFSDCTPPKVLLTAFPFVGPPLQPTP